MRFVLAFGVVSCLADFGWGNQAFDQHGHGVIDRRTARRGWDTSTSWLPGADAS
ncbi:MAG: hypothetical protein ACRDRO_25930 [Pseudonocardiaceae bacterium]